MHGEIFDPHVYPMDKSWWTGHAPPARDEERGISNPQDGSDDHPTGS